MATETNAVPGHVGGQLEVTECPIAKLADEDLAAIFKHLPPFERLIVSEVCQKWRDLSQTPWRDVTHLDLSQVPTANIHAVLRKCANVTSVSALQHNLGHLCSFIARLNSVASLKCIDCNFTVLNTTPPSAVCACLRNAPLAELTWHNSKAMLMYADVLDSVHHFPFSLPCSLRRVQLSGLHVENDYVICDVDETFCLPLLECFIMADVIVQDPQPAFLGSANPGRVALSALSKSANLRELYLDSPDLAALVKLLFALPKLHVLFLHNIMFEFDQQHLERIITQHRSLRVLVITASHVSDFVGYITISVRKLFPNGFNAPSVPQLDLLLGKIAAEKLRFHPSPNDALKIHPINAPLPEFLEKKEIKPIFEGSWIASRIKEGAKEGANLADYAFEGNAESISYVQE